MTDSKPVRIRRNGAWILVALFHLGLAEGEVLDEADIGLDSDDRFIVVLFPPQTRVYEHFYLVQRKKQPQVPPLQWKTRHLAEDYALGLYGDQAVPLIGPEFDISLAIYALINELDTGADWSIHDIVEHPFYDNGVSSDMRRIQAAKLLEGSAAKGVIYLEFMALLSPDYDRLRVIARVAAFETRRLVGARKTFENRYEYFSPSRGITLGDSLDSDTAFAEAWPPELMAAAIRVGIDRLRPMITADIREFDSHRPKTTRFVEFDYISMYWLQTKREGAIVDTREWRAVYRDRVGNVYSMPKE